MTRWDRKVLLLPITLWYRLSKRGDFPEKL